MNDQSESQNELKRVLEKIQEIVEKSADGDYIYRGEPEQYEGEPYLGKVSSNLYREYIDVDAEHFDITVVQKEILDKAREYVSENTSDFEILTELQHRGGNTNLIDFTTDYLIAFFFACDGSHDKPGRIILLNKQAENYKVERASKGISRAESQKSIFVQSDTGFLEPEQYEVISIPSDIKSHILDYLQKYHDISTNTIYNDLQGFIENRRFHHSAYTEFYRGLTCKNRGDLTEDQVKKETLYQQAITYYSKSIELKPDLSDVYNNRGTVYEKTNEFSKAIQDYNTAIGLKSDDGQLYSNRGTSYARMGKLDKAIKDFKKAIEIGPASVNTYNNSGIVYFKKGNFDNAIQEYNNAIELNSDSAIPYNNRAEVWLCLGKWKKAKMDLVIAKDSGVDIIREFHNKYKSIEDFEQRNKVQLPEDIAAMLRRQ